MYISLSLPGGKHDIDADCTLVGTLTLSSICHRPNVYLYSNSSTKAVATSGHLYGSSRSNTAKPVVAKDMQDTVDEMQIVKQEMAKQLSRDGCQCGRESESGTERVGDDDDDETCSEEESDNDDDTDEE